LTIGGSNQTNRHKEIFVKKIICLVPLMSLLMAGCTLSASSSQDISSLNSAGTTSETSAVTSAETSSLPVPEGYELAWEDQFETDNLNLDYWTYMLGDGTGYGVYRWGNNEAQYYTTRNAAVSSGQLVITAKAETVGEYDYTSARLRTAGKVSTRYGRVEARISLPEVEGMWPAFWMLPEDSPYGGWPDSGEIDIMENRGADSGVTSGALHYGSPHEYQSGSYELFQSFISDFHVYAVEWEPTEIRWFVDDVNFLTVTHEQWFSSGANEATNPYAPFDQDFHILINLAVGGNFNGGVLPPESFTEASMYVDYVRILHAIS